MADETAPDTPEKTAPDTEGSIFLEGSERSGMKVVYLLVSLACLFLMIFGSNSAGIGLEITVGVVRYQAPALEAGIAATMFGIATTGIVGRKFSQR